MLQFLDAYRDVPGGGAAGGGGLRTSSTSSASSTMMPMPGGGIMAAANMSMDVGSLAAPGAVFDGRVPSVTSVEQHVALVHCVPFKGLKAVLGPTLTLPAFDERKKLLGFYREIPSGEGEGYRTEVLFLALAELDEPLDKATREKLEKAATEAEGKDDSSIKTLESVNYNHMRLREDAFIHVFSHKEVAV